MSKVEKYINSNQKLRLMQGYILDRQDPDNRIPQTIKDHVAQLELMHTWYFKFKDPQVVKELYLERMKSLGSPIHPDTANRHFLEMKRVFGLAEKIDKPYERLFLLNWLRQRMVAADKAGDNKGFAMLADRYERLLQLDREDIPDHLLNDPIPFFFGDYPEEEGGEMTDEEARDFEKRFRAKVTKKVDDEAEDVDYEETA